MGVYGQSFPITSDEHIPFWELARAIGDTSGHPTRKEDVKSITKIVGFYWQCLMIRVNQTRNEWQSIGLYVSLQSHCALG